MFVRLDIKTILKMYTEKCDRFKVCTFSGFRFSTPLQKHLPATFYFVFHIRILGTCG